MATKQRALTAASEEINLILEEKIADMSWRLGELELKVARLVERLSQPPTSGPAEVVETTKRNKNLDDSSFGSSDRGSLSVAQVRLPRTLTIRGLEKALLEGGIEVKNNRVSGTKAGGLWVYATKGALQPLVDQLLEHGVMCRYYRAQERRRDPRPAWELDSEKKLR